MSTENSAEIIDLGASRAAAGGAGAGPFLASARAAAGFDIAHVAAATKIKPAHIEAIEAGDAAALPATPFAVGFVKVYAAFLGLDADAVAADFKKELNASRPEPEEKAAAIPAYDASAGVKMISLLGILLIGAFAVWIGFQIAGNSEREAQIAADEAAPRVRVSEVRAEAPRPRSYANDEYEVTPIPPVGEAADSIATAPAGESAAAVIDDAAPILAPALVEAAPIEPGVEERVAEPEILTSAPQANAPLVETTPTEAPADARQPSVADELMLAQTLPPIVEPEPVRRQPRPAARPQPQPEIIEARLIRSIGPQYPRRCERSAGDLETVSVIFDVNANGRTTNARVTNASNSCFEDAAVKAIAKWRFDPRTVDGAARPQTGLQATLNFRR